MIRLFFSYAHQDEILRDTLEKHLSVLKNQGLIETWNDRRIMPGDELNGEISQNLEKADIILLLVSVDFISSHYCYDVEMTRAIERHNEGKARVVPVILRPCDWQDTPFGKLLAAPKDGKPVINWPDLDEAFLDITKSIKKIIYEQNAESSNNIEQIHLHASSFQDLTPLRVVDQSRSSNLRIRKAFTEADQDTFLESAFEYMATFFQNSLTELQNRNSELSTKFRRIDSNRFTAAIYQGGKAISRCKIILSGALYNGITYSSTDHPSDNSYNEGLSVKNDDQNMYLSAMGMPFHGNGHDAHLTSEGAAEYYWSILMRPLQ